ncbi:uncharacterized protein LOC141648750 [Silene latifolia]|uniref:uncharacterized protein LOC141648750 n=1 Tax=Silene latifolia TaxID=37657 RepID=UPI003D76B4CF
MDSVSQVPVWVLFPDLDPFLWSDKVLSKMAKQANTTLLALIPKKPVVETVMDYRPIACCTVFYKTVSKILCSRLKPFLPDIVGKEQGHLLLGEVYLKILKEM